MTSDPGFLGWLAEVSPETLEVTRDLADAGPLRPFCRPRDWSFALRGQRIEAVLRRVGFARREDALRVCDRATRERPAAQSIFELVGAKQVGGATVDGWTTLVRPALLDPFARKRTFFWPFDGTLAELTARPGVTLAETYPAELYEHLGLPRAGKRQRDVRLAVAPRLLEVARAHGLALTRGALDAIEDGFGDDATGEDRYDAMVGALGLALVALGKLDPREPSDPTVRRTEGWMVGRPIGNGACPTARPPTR